MTDSLRDPRQRRVHHHWLKLLSAILPCTQALANSTSLVTKVISDVCLIFEQISKEMDVSDRFVTLSHVKIRLPQGSQS